MAEPDDVLRAHVAALSDIAAGVPGGITGLTAARDADLVELITAAQRVVLSAEGILAAAAGEVSRRSTGSGDASLARRLGHRSARGLVAAKAGVSFGIASRIVDVGEAIRPGVALSGAQLPAERSSIADAVLAGRLPLAVAQLVDVTVEKVESRLILDQAARLEQDLVHEFLTGRYSIAQFSAYCDQVIDLLDPDRIKPDDDARRKRACITETWLPNGMLRIVAELDPEAAAFYRAAVRARTNPRRSKHEDGGGPEAAATGGTASDGAPSEGASSNSGAADGTATAEGPTNVTSIGVRRDPSQPTPMESKVHAFIGIMRDALRAEDGRQAGVDTTVLVRIDLDALLSGIGSATVDGIRTPIPASAVRRLAAEADLIPQVLDGRSQLLDQGESKRLFTRAQRYAILSAFTGCAFPHCDIPSSMVEFHHVGRWAERGEHRHGTDLQNGLPLCGFHNRLMEDGWDVRFDADRIPWFTPPVTVDVLQRPLHGGNLVPRRAA